MITRRANIHILCFALLSSFEIDCFEGLWSQIHEYSPVQFRRWLPHCLDILIDYSLIQMNTVQLYNKHTCPILSNLLYSYKWSGFVTWSVLQTLLPSSQCCRIYSIRTNGVDSKLDPDSGSTAFVSIYIRNLILHMAAFISTRRNNLSNGLIRRIRHRMKNHICPHIRTGCRECKCRECNTFAIVRINVQMWSTT